MGFPTKRSGTIENTVYYYSHDFQTPGKFKSIDLRWDDIWLISCEFGILKWKNQYSSKKYPLELQNLNGD
jgi:hypothetical protein